LSAAPCWAFILISDIFMRIEIKLPKQISYPAAFDLIEKQMKATQSDFIEIYPLGGTEKEVLIEMHAAGRLPPVSFHCGRATIGESNYLPMKK
jgi:hypothetical protein